MEKKKNYKIKEIPKPSKLNTNIIKTGGLVN